MSSSALAITTIDVDVVASALRDELAAAITAHDAMTARDLNRRRVRAYAEGLLRALNLIDAACGLPTPGSLAEAARWLQQGPHTDPVDQP
jgi:hypothetical protein